MVLSMSQVYGISQAPAAILIYLAVIIYSPISAAFAVLGAILGTLTGKPCHFNFQSFESFIHTNVNVGHTSRSNARAMRKIKHDKLLLGFLLRD